MPTRRRTEILLAFYRLVATIRFGNPEEWRQVDLEHRISDYFPGNGVAFANQVNQAEFFHRDGIFMEPNDFRNKVALSDLYSEIIEKYLDNNWRLVA